MRSFRLLAFGVMLTLAGALEPALAQPAACTGRLYLTFDTGNMSQAHFIADTLRQHHIKASFFLANEKTTSDNYALDPACAPFWRTLAQE
ncbi:MAG: hypothetical protein HYZ45_14035 [Burkholderiales bacterium]|nr:hypothetical protein [Burkholderiales bacterium]